MQIENFSSIESQLLSAFNQGNKTFDGLLGTVPFGEKTLTITLEGLLSKNVLKFDKKTSKYEYDSPISDEMIILDGNILLPTTVIRIPNKGIMYVSRGSWYQFPIDFDIRRIIWNVKLQSKTNSTLVELIKTSILKERKSKIIQLPEYESLRNKIVPYSPTIGLMINTVGEEFTDISIQFKIKLVNEDISPEHRGFSVRTEISTTELLQQLKTPVAQRNYIECIKINQIFNFSDFIFSKNEIPVSIKNSELTYVKITGVKKQFELTYFKLGLNGMSTKLDVENYDDSNEAIEKLRDIFRGMPNLILSENNFMCELTE